MSNYKSKDFNKTNNIIENIKNNPKNKMKPLDVNSNYKINISIIFKLLLYFLLIIISLIYVFYYKNNRFNI